MSLLADAYVQLKVQGQQAVYGALSSIGGSLAKLAQKSSVLISAFGKMGAAIKKSLAALASPLGSLFKNLSNKIKLFGQQASNAFQKGGAGNTAAMRAGLKGLAKDAKSAQAALQKLAANVTKLSASLRKATTATGRLGTSLKGLGTDIGVAARKKDAFIDNLQALTEQLSKAVDAARDLGEAITAAWSAIIPVVGPVFNYLRISLTGIFRVAISPVRAFFSLVQSGFQAVANGARRLVGALLSPLSMLRSFLTSWQGLLAMVGVSLSGAAISRYIAHWTADAESAQVSFKVLLGSAGQAVTLLNQLQELADKTPLQLPEVRDAAKHLLAMGVQATAVTDTIRRLGDVSQGLGLDLNHVADIYGKVSQANRLTGEDMRRFRLNGIPIARELAIMLGKTTQEIEHMAHTGTLKFADVENVFKRMTDQGGIFFNLMKEKSQTLEGLFSTMQDSLRNLAVYFGQGLAPAVKDIERRIIDFLDNAKEKIWPLRNQFRLMAEELAGKLPNALKFVENAIPHVVEGIKTFRAVMNAVREMAAEVGHRILAWAGGTKSVEGGLRQVLQYIRFLAQEWRLVFDIATTRVKIFAYDWQNELLSAFSGLFEKLQPYVVEFGRFLLEIVGAALEKAGAGLLRGFSAAAKSVPGMGLLFGPDIQAADAMADKLSSEASQAFRAALDRYKISLSPDQEKAKQQREKMAQLLKEFNDRFAKFQGQLLAEQKAERDQREREIASQIKGEPLQNRPGLPQSPEQEKKAKGVATAFHSFTDFWKHMQSAIHSGEPLAIAKKSLEEQKKSVKLQQKTNELLGRRMVPVFGP